MPQYTRNRPIRVRPEFYQQKVPVETNSKLPAILDGKVAEDIGDALQPTQDQFIEIVKFLCERKKWTLATFAQLLNIPQLRLTRMVNKDLQIDGVTARLIWMFYIMDVAPGHLLNPAFILTWGHTAVKIPSKIDSGTIDTVKAAIDMNKVSQVHQTPYEIQAMCSTAAGIHIDMQVLRRILKELKYVVRKKQGAKRTQPDSIWMQVDWSKNDTQIAQQIGMSKAGVIQARRYLRKLPREQLVLVFQNAGRDLQAVDALLRCHVQPKKIDYDDSRTPETSNPSV